jgi:hypothetical protein
MVPVLAGLVGGFAAALALIRPIRSLISGVSETDLRAFAGAGILLAAVAAPASRLPARHAARRSGSNQAFRMSCAACSPNCRSPQPRANYLGHEV